MRRVIGFSLKFRSVIVAIAVGIMLFGGVQLSTASVDVFPEFAPPKVEIQTICIGLTAEEVEQLVTVPLEEALNGVEGLDDLRSKSVEQLSSVVMIFEPGTDLLTARQMVSERIAIVVPTLPTWAAPPVMLQPLSSTSRVMKIGLTSDERSLMEMSMITYWKIRAHLLRVPGVANVAIWGERLQMLQVQAEPDKMLAEGVSLNQVMDVTANALDAGLLQYSPGALIGTGGSIGTPNQQLGIQHVLPIATAEDLANVTIEDRDGTPLKLGDVATVVEDHQPLIGDAVINNGEGLMLIVEKLPWGNTLEVTEGVEAALEEMKPGLSGIDIDTAIFRPASFIEESLDNLTRSLLLGCLLVMMVLGAFLFQWRTALISLIAIPLSLVSAALVLYLTGSSINTMVLAGLVIAVGVVVDDAIIDIENIIRRLRQHRASGSTRSTSSVVLEASLEVRGPIVYATLIIVVAAIPIFFLEGLTGAFFRPLAISYTLAVLASMVVALTVTPALALLFMRNLPLKEQEPPLVRVLKRGYRTVLKPIVRRPAGGYILFGSLAATGALVAPLLGQSLLPDFKERDFLMHWVTQPGTSVAEEYRISKLACQELLTIDGVNNCGAHIGQAFAADEVVGVHFGENWISIDPEADYEKTHAAVLEMVEGYPGIHRDVQTYLKERIREVLTGSSNAVVVRLYGDDLNLLRSTGDDILEIFEKIPGAIDEHVALQVDIPQLSVKVDLEKAQTYGLKPGDVRRAAATLVAGEEVGDVYRGGKAYDVQVWSPVEIRSDVSSIRNLPIDTPSGEQIKLSDVADVKLIATPNVIQREEGSRRIDIEANVEDGTLGTVVAAMEAGLADLELPTGFHAEVLGEFQEREAASRLLLTLALLALAVIFLLLQAAFGSWRLATLIMLTLPIALVGGVFAAFLGGGVLSLGSIVGFLTVMGIAARNSILLINHCQHLEKKEGVTFGPELVLRGAGERLSPILMTTLATGLALVPLVVMGNLPGHEIEHPMALVILGGLFTSTLLNLFVVPSLYLRFAKSKASLVPAEL
ncbi:heavy metal efflux pump, CzcA family [Cryobacterium psychrotolerans]|uniref:Heavy metal efflux pump, CzcA family n=1 Tax=Cryobacterium psychrotolerans TaxID=386301 RepID=A0A1G8XCG7_9MICO|nr:MULTISPECIES: efflux RND transporter permease subunit [Cryobacterium]TFD45739.1 efflux RND transporter permease subunit [Cryobacterium sp. TMT1-2-1]TFD82954.1 efflux RND transporter permease subunit [Cryobacterium psychrotolerans]SDJ88282.1 heavy metal efflux pump, CzcA family [Cryobacterium psychrotolerans]